MFNKTLYFKLQYVLWYLFLNLKYLARKASDFVRNLLSNTPLHWVDKNISFHRMPKWSLITFSSYCFYKLTNEHQCYQLCSLGSYSNSCYSSLNWYYYIHFYLIFSTNICFVKWWKIKLPRLSWNITFTFLNYFYFFYLHMFIWTTFCPPKFGIINFKWYFHVYI